MDFITELPESKGNTNLMVVTDRLSKDVILIPLANLRAETVADAFIHDVVAYHWFPDAIVSDRGSQFVSQFWKYMCDKLGVLRRLSTAFHPETDGSTERMNSTVEAYLRAFVNWDQDNWAELCPAAQIAIKGRTATSTGVSPFFLQHGYEVDPIQWDNDNNCAERHRSILNPKQAAEAMLRKFLSTFEFVQANMAVAQQEQERQSNRRRQEAPLLRVGDKVWLQYGSQLSNHRPSKKLDWKNAKFQVVRIVSPHAVELNTPPGVYPVFHVDRLRLAPGNSLPSQEADDWQPPSIEVDGEEEWEIDDIMSEKLRRQGRGRILLYEVQWKGYAATTWEPAENLIDTEALERWKDFTAPSRNSSGSLPANFRRPLQQYLN